MTQDIVYPIEEKPGLVSNDNSQNPQHHQQQIHQHGEKKQQCFEMDSWHKNFLELKEIIRQEQIHRRHDNKKGQEEEEDDDDDDDDDDGDSMQLIAEIRQKGSSSDETLESSSKSAINMQHDQNNSRIETLSKHNGQCPSPVCISLERLQRTNPKIAKWISEQKTSAKKWEAGLDTRMTHERSDLLHSISFFHIFQNKYDEGWNEQFERLKKHYNETGNLNVKEYDLKRWMRKQKQEYDAFENMNVVGCSSMSSSISSSSISSETPKTATSTTTTTISSIHAVKTTMTRERMDKLDSIHFSSYNPSTFTSDPKFEHKIQELKEFQLRHGHLRIPKNCPFNKSLGRWVTRIRAQYRLYKEGKPHYGVITESRIEQLESIGFEWQSTSKFTANVTWDKRFEELVEYQKKHQSTNVPGKYKANPALGTWVRNQRCQYWAKRRGKKSPMTEKRIEKLQSIGFRW